MARKGQCPLCGSENVACSVRFAFCEECDWQAGEKISREDKQALLSIVRVMLDKENTKESLSQ